MHGTKKSSVTSFIGNLNVLLDWRVFSEVCFKNSTFLEELEGKITEELNKLLVREHIYWKKKAGIRWIQRGEQNTKYFN